MSKLLCLLLIIFLPSCFSAQTSTQISTPTLIQTPPQTLGDDHLALLSKHYHPVASGQMHKNGDAIGVLDWTFGQRIGNLRAFAREAVISSARIHLINGVCVRNMNCGEYEVGYRYNMSGFNQLVLNRNPKVIAHVKKRVKLYHDFFTYEFPGIKPLISPILEHNLTKEAWRILADTVKNEWPEVQLVNSAMNGQGERYRGAWVEDHGNSGLTPGADIISTDGTEIMDINSMKYVSDTSHSRIAFRWSRRNNCRAQGSFVDPRDRKSCLTKREAEQQTHVTDKIPEGNPKTFNCRSGDWAFTQAEIWKPLSEDKGTGDSRANLPVLITGKFGTGTVTLVDFRGNTVGHLGYYGKFTDGRLRFYSGFGSGSRETGFQFQNKSVGTSGANFTWARQGNKCIGPFIAGRRQGNYR